MYWRLKLHPEREKSYGKQGTKEEGKNFLMGAVPSHVPPFFRGREWLWGGGKGGDKGCGRGTKGEAVKKR